MTKKVAIVTGNGDGLGKALSERLPDLGFEKALIVRSKDYDLTKADDCFKLQMISMIHTTHYTIYYILYTM